MCGRGPIFVRMRLLREHTPRRRVPALTLQGALAWRRVRVPALLLALGGVRTIRMPLRVLRNRKLPIFFKKKKETN